MNKNLKRALNTTAAVSMSLAMVLGAVAPVTNVSAAWVSAATNTMKFNSAEAFVKAFVDINNDVKEIKLTDSVAVPSNYTCTGTATLQGILGATITKKEATANDALRDGENFKTILEFYVDNFNLYGDEENKDYYDAAAHIVGKDSLSGRKTVVDFAGTKSDGTKGSLLNFIDTYLASWNADKEVPEYTAAVKEKYEEAQDYVDYVGNLADDAKAEKFNDWFEKATEAKNEYNDENNDEFVQDYIDALEKATVLTVNGTALSVRDLVEKEENVSYKEVAKVESFLKALKADKKLDEELKYDDVKDEAEIAEMVEGLEAIVEEMKEAKDLLKSTSAAAKDYAKVDNKVAAVISAMNTKTYTDRDGTHDYTDVEIQENIEDALSEFRASDVEKLKTYVEEVFNQFYTVSPRETSRGTYVLRLEKAEYGRYVGENADKANGGEFDNNLVELLTTTVDKNESADSYYDVLVTRNTTIDDLLKAVTEDIEGIVFNSTLTDADAAKIIAAKKAYTELVARDFAGLTFKEKTAAKANKELIDALYIKLIYNSDVVKTGWVQNSDGSWSFLEEDGTVRQEGWVAGNGTWSFVLKGKAVYNGWCPAKEGWYYMGADGYMVSDTTMTIDGISYTFDANGLLVD